MRKCRPPCSPLGLGETDSVSAGSFGAAGPASSLDARPKAILADDLNADAELGAINADADADADADAVDDVFIFMLLKSDAADVAGVAVTDV